MRVTFLCGGCMLLGTLLECLQGSSRGLGTMKDVSPLFRTTSGWGTVGLVLLVYPSRSSMLSGSCRLKFDTCPRVS